MAATSAAGANDDDTADDESVMTLAVLFDVLIC